MSNISGPDKKHYNYIIYIILEEETWENVKVISQFSIIFCKGTLWLGTSKSLKRQIVLHCSGQLYRIILHYYYSVLLCSCCILEKVLYLSVSDL